MGTSRSGAELAGKLDRLAREIADTRRPVTAAALVGKQIFNASASAAGVSRVVKARYDLESDRRAVVRYVGWRAPMLEAGAKPHRIVPRRRRRGGERRALMIGGDVRASANHPGFRGKRFAAAAKAIAIRELPSLYQRAQVTLPLRKIFG